MENDMKVQRFDSLPLDATYFTDGWCDENLYNNSPVHFLENMPSDHPYIQLYNERKIILCVGQGNWESEGIRTTGQMADIFYRKGIHGWTDFWGAFCIVIPTI